MSYTDNSDNTKWFSQGGLPPDANIGKTPFNDDQNLNALPGAPLNVSPSDDLHPSPGYSAAIIFDNNAIINSPPEVSPPTPQPDDQQPPPGYIDPLILYEKPPDDDPFENIAIRPPIDFWDENGKWIPTAEAYREPILGSIADGSLALTSDMLVKLELSPIETMQLLQGVRNNSTVYNAPMPTVDQSLVGMQITPVAEKAANIEQPTAEAALKAIQELEKAPEENKESIDITQSGKSSVDSLEETALRLADKFLKLEKICIYEESTYIWTGNYYRKIERSALGRRIRTRLSADIELHGSPSIVDSIIKSIMLTESLVKTEDDICTNCIAFDNCVLDLRTQQTYPHNPEAFILYAIKAGYYRAVATPRFDRFLDVISCGDKKLQKRIWEMIGYLLTPDTRGKALILFQGLPNSGKSTLVNILEMLFSNGAVYHLNANDFAGQFSLSGIPGRILCVSSDMPSSALKTGAVSRIKQLTGRDRIVTDVKFKDQIDFRNTAKLVFVTNHPFYVRGGDDALMDRIRVVPFGYSIPKNERENDLEEALLAERDGIVYKALQHYFSILPDYKFTGDDEYLVNTVLGNQSLSADDGIFAYVRDNFVASENDTVFISDALNDFAAKYFDMPLQVFSSKFQNAAAILFKAKHTRKRKPGNDNPQSCLQGIAFKRLL